MSELTQEEKLARTRRREIYLRWALGACVAIIVFVFLFKSCGDAANNKAYGAVRDTLESVLGDTARINKEARRLQKENMELDSALADLIADRDMIQGALVTESIISKYWRKEYEAAKSKKDTARQLQSCDSLARSYDSLLVKIGWEREVGVIIENNYDSLLRISDSAAKHWKRAYTSCLNAVTFSVDELPKTESKGQWYLTGGVLWNGPVLGAQGGITHINKKRLLISGKASLTSYGWGGSVDVGIPLRLGKR